jgi:hypothetical protein
LVSLFGSGIWLRADDSAAPSPTIWRMEDPATIGGHTATVLGAPKAIDEGGNKAMYFNGVGDGLLLPVNPLEGLASFSIEVLFRPERDGEEAQRFLHVQDGEDNRALIEIRLKDGQWALDTFLRSNKTSERSVLFDPKKLHPAGAWTWVALVYGKGHMAHFINGVKELEGQIDLPPMGPGQISLGVRLNKVFWFKGCIREVRIHPVALAPEALQRMDQR